MDFHYLTRNAANCINEGACSIFALSRLAAVDDRKAPSVPPKSLAERHSDRLKPFEAGTCSGFGRPPRLRNKSATAPETNSSANSCHLPVLGVEARIGTGSQNYETARVWGFLSLR